jgi:hypothetical protein
MLYTMQASATVGYWAADVFWSWKTLPGGATTGMRAANHGVRLA